MLVSFIRQGFFDALTYYNNKMIYGVHYQENNLYQIFILDRDYIYSIIDNDIICDVNILLEMKYRVVKRCSSKIIDGIDKMLDMMKCENLVWEYQKTNFIDDAIIAMTSYPKRIQTTGKHIKWLNKSCPEFRVVLTLSVDEFPNKEEDLPDDLRYEDICDILWIKGKYKSSKKFIFAMEKYPDKYIITADDDIYYGTNYALELYNFIKKNPECKCVCYSAYPHPIGWIRGPYTILKPSTYPSILKDKQKILTDFDIDEDRGVYLALEKNGIKQYYLKMGGCNESLMFMDDIEPLCYKRENRNRYTITNIFNTVSTIRSMGYDFNEIKKMLQKYEDPINRYTALYGVPSDNITSNDLPRVFWYLTEYQQQLLVAIYIIEKYGGKWAIKESLVEPKNDETIILSNDRIISFRFSSNSVFMNKWKEKVYFILEHYKGCAVTDKEIGIDIVEDLIKREKLNVTLVSVCKI